MDPCTGFIVLIVGLILAIVRHLKTGGQSGDGLGGC